MDNQDINKNADILERVSELPEDLRKVLFARETAATIGAVGKKFELMIDKVGILADETGRVMLGITPPEEYVKNLSQKLDIHPEKAKEIASEINQKVFQQVRESLKKIHGITTLPASLKPGFEAEKKPGFSPAGEASTSTSKPLPIIEEIKKPIAPVIMPDAPRLPEIKPDIAVSELPIPKPEKTEEIPSIFVKKIPSITIESVEAEKVMPAGAPISPDALAAKNALEKMLESAPAAPESKPPENSAKTQAPPQNRDPYREPIEP